MSSTVASTATATSSMPSSTTTGGGGGGSNGPSSPLLFFVALGFGVVFTNLWIIVGVKYCFRYNQRNRQRMNGEDPDGVDLGTMPRQRRRREKKLMTMDEVNEKFPLTKYKAWRTTRAAEGLPTAGGITTTTQSRPASVHNVARESKEVEPQTVVQPTPPTPAVNTEEKAIDGEHGRPEVIRNDTAVSTGQTPAASNSRPKSEESALAPEIEAKHEAALAREDEAEEDDQIQTAVPAEQLPDPGDACAICIDTIEDDDDVRGLSCGHAFHASCVDPWLTSRRACCPLCKADYYVPKPRPEGADAEGGRRRPDGTPGPPQSAFVRTTGPNGTPRRPVMILPGRFMTIVYDERDRYGFPRVVREPNPNRPSRRQNRRGTAATVANPETLNQESQPVSETQDRSWVRRLTEVRIPNPISGLRGNRPNAPSNTTNANPSSENPTPGQLEAGRT